MKKIYFLLFFISLTTGSIAQTTTYSTASSTGYAYTVPPNVTQLAIDMTGAQGGNGNSGCAGGMGARVLCTVNVTAGTVYYVYVGGVGGNNGSATGGVNGGGSGSSLGGGGGGASDIRTSQNSTYSNRIIVAGAGGGGGYDCSGSTQCNGGAGGTTGGAGYLCTSLCSYYGGQGGTASSGGAGASGYCSSPGGFGTGGNSCHSYGGGGGGGWYGGGSGAYAGGGGGSSYMGGAGVIPGGTITSGYQPGSGYVKINALCNLPGTIVGNTPICPGATLSLSDPTGAAGGTWSIASSSSAVATVSGTGVVTAVGTGTAIVTYSLVNVCSPGSPTITVTVGAVPAVITGTPSGNVCTGNTVSLSNSSSGGVWSSNSGTVTVNSTSGVVTAVTAGSPTITYTLPLGCSPATTTFNITTQPGSITGTATICQGTTTNLSNSSSGGTWTSSNTAIATVSSSGVVTGVSGGSCTISYTLSGGCFSTYAMNINPIGSITGVTSICNGTSSTLSDVVSGGTWTSSNTAVGSINASSGTFTAISVGSTTITYSLSTGCKSTALASVSGSPNVYSVTGGGTYCSGGSGVHIGVNNSDVGVGYQLFIGASPVGVPVIGTGSALDLGSITGAGTYNVIANPGSSCATNMLGTETVSVTSLPTTYSLTGGGVYCSGTSGTNVGLSGTSVGVTYQLFAGVTPIGSPVTGTSFPINFGLQTTAGTYSVIATSTSTGCTNTMSGSGTLSVSVGSLPNSFAVTGGGSYCLGGSGVHIGVAGSVIGNNYQLSLSGTLVGSVLSGTGGALDFGLITTAGNYVVTAWNPATTCTSNMAGNAVVSINPLPAVATVGGGGSYCLGGTGLNITLGSSVTGVNYQLYTGSSPVGTPVAGTGVALTFGPVTNAGSYTVLGTNTSTGCSSNMFGSASVSLTALPAVFTVTGGGGYCAGGSGVNIGLSGSVSGTNYTLYSGASIVGAASGTGSPFNFSTLFTSPGTYTVVGTTPSTGCVGNMSGRVVVTINPLPIARNVTGGGSYCAGGNGLVIGLDSSYTGINYQLVNGTSVIPGYLSGTTGIGPVNFPAQTAAGSYSVVGVNSITGCTNNMSGSASIIINPVPVSYAVTGGGGYCAGGTGVHVGLAASNTGIKYVLTNGSSTFATMTGTGAALDFGLQTAAGTYTVNDTNTTSLCASRGSGTAVVSVNSGPTPYTVNITGGGAICAGSGAVVNLTNSATGVNYQLYNGTSPVGVAVLGTGSAISFGPQYTAGTYGVVGTNTTTGCTGNMSNTAAITIVPLPGIFAVTGGGVNCVGGAGVNIGLSGSATGINYQLMHAGATVGTVVAGTGSAISFGLDTAAGSYTVVASLTGASSCTSNMAGSATITTLTASLPGLYTISGGGNYCYGGTGVSIGLSGSAPGFNYQLYNGITPVGAPMTGTSAALSFGTQTTSGIYDVVATNAATGCNATMTGTASVVVNPLPPAHNVTGGGSYCPGSTGLAIGLNGSDVGITYQLFNGGTAVGTTQSGTGAALNFGSSVTAIGLYTIVANNGLTTCSGNMTGSATIGVYSLPVAYNVTGGGSYCTGGTGVNVGLNNSNTGVSYQLFNYAVPASILIPGTGAALNFGLQTSGGTYTVVATGTTTTCVNNMTGSATVVVNPLPATHNVIGGGTYCSGGTGVMIGLNGSNTSTDYQLYSGGVAFGSPVPGTGSPVNFGLITPNGNYSVVATNTATTCVNNMIDSAMVSINALPTAYPLTGGGNYCTGGAGLDISIGSSDPGISYQLYNGTTAVGSAAIGSGSGGVDFGSQTAAGVYTVVGTNTGTSCINSMAGSATIVIDPLPTAYTVSGGGSYCAGSAGPHVMLSGSNPGNTYQLWMGGSVVTSILGTGTALDFGSQTVGGTYTVLAVHNATSCQNMMAGSATIVVNPLPNPYTVNGLGTNYCAGGAGVDIIMSGSDAGINYQLSEGTGLVGGVVAGTGAIIDFGFHTLAGSYNVTAVNPVTRCSSVMPGTASIATNPLPTAYVVTGGGSYCNGGTGVHVGLSSSSIGTTYQLYDDAGPVAGHVLTGTGFVLDFGLQTTAGHYTVMATGVTSGCTSNMSGTATVAIDPLPALFTITGGGNYCATGTGVDVALSNSALGVSYQLYNGTTITGAPITGTGFPIDFGMQTAGGSYKVVGTYSSTGCNSSMAGTATIVVNPLPVAYPVSGGGSYCPGGTGVNIGLVNSSTGVSYQLYNGTMAVAGLYLGSGSSITFGAQTAPGIYSVIATDNVTHCSNTMSGSAVVNISPLPTTYVVTGGGYYCAGGAGVHVGLSNSNTGVNYTLMVGGARAMTLPGTGGVLDFGNQTVAGTYTVVASNATSGCTSNMTGDAVVTIVAPVVPTASISISGGSDTVCSGSLITFTAITTNGGLTPIYRWMVGTAVVGTSNNYVYSPSNGDMVSLSVTSSALCAMPPTVNTDITMTVENQETPLVAISAAPGTDVCQGTIVNFTPTPTYGGSAPTYTWSVNGIALVTAPTYSYIPTNGDRVSCVMNSNYHCQLAGIINSNIIDMQVDPATAPVVSISASVGNMIGAGETDVLTATVVNGGPSPTFQWYINGVPVSGATSPTFIYSNFNNLDSVTCEVISSGGCSGHTGFNSLTMYVHGVGVPQVASATDNIRLIPNPSKGDFIVKGTLGTTADEDVAIKITNVVGQIIYNNTVSTHNGNINERIQLNNNLANGMYLLNLHSDSDNKVFHLVIEQ